MKETMKKQPAFSLGKEVAKKEQKKVLGGAAVGTCPGKRCVNSLMNCTASPISSGYCWAVWPASGGVMENCTATNCV